ARRVVLRRVEADAAERNQGRLRARAQRPRAFPPLSMGARRVSAAASRPALYARGMQASSTTAEASNRDLRLSEQGLQERHAQGGRHEQPLPRAGRPGPLTRDMERELIELPRETRPILTVVVHTEEEFDWGKPHDRNATSVQHMRHIGHAQRIFDE